MTFENNKQYYILSKKESIKLLSKEKSKKTFRKL